VIQYRYYYFKISNEIESDTYHTLIDDMIAIENVSFSITVLRSSK